MLGPDFRQKQEHSYMGKQQMKGHVLPPKLRASEKVLALLARLYWHLRLMCFLGVYPMISQSHDYI